MKIIQTLGDPRRLEILRLLMVEPATLSQLGAEMGLHPAKVRFHLKKLEGANLVAFVSSREVRGFVEKYYRATAQAYFINLVVFPQPDQKRTIISLGSDDLALELLADQLDQDDSMPRLMALPVGSLDGLIALRQGICQMTGCHLYDPIDREYNASYVRHFFPGQPMHLITLAHRLQGLLVPPGNPKGIQGLGDLVGEGLTFINRKPGSGTRLWLDQQLKAIRAEPHLIRGYTNEVNTHSQVAEEVLSGNADVGLAVLAAARHFHLDFIPLFEERYDLVIPEVEFQSDLLVPMLEHLNSAQFRNSLAKLGGYDPHDTGKEAQIK
ncbi:MAG: ArsR family transcriptional regulator [Anaerolineales bacterium]|nr:ArsR family transcriptional regulator [Anaerolineales bacterium]